MTQVTVNGNTYDLDGVRVPNLEPVNVGEALGVLVDIAAEASAGAGDISTLQDDITDLQGGKGQVLSSDVAGVPDATLAANLGRLIWVTNGNAGVACPAISDGTNWKVIALGATISAS